MFYGQFVSGSVYLTTDGSGLPIREAAEPTPGDGYHTSLAYEQRDGAIWQVWTIVPDAGTAQDAALMLAQIQASRLSVSVNLFFTSFAKQAHRSRKGGFTGCANVFSPIPVTT